MEASSSALGSANQTTVAGEISHTKLQPKFKDCSFDSKKNPEYLRTWLRLLSGIVRNIAGGKQLEDFLDYKLGRRHKQSNTRPAFLNDPDLQVEAPNGDDGDSASTNDAPLTYEGPTVYYELDEASKTLDSALFSPYLLSCKGPISTSSPTSWTNVLVTRLLLLLCGSMPRWAMPLVAYKP